MAAEEEGITGKFLVVAIRPPLLELVGLIGFELSPIDELTPAVPSPVEQVSLVPSMHAMLKESRVFLRARGLGSTTLLLKVTDLRGERGSVPPASCSTTLLLKLDLDRVGGRG